MAFGEQQQQQEVTYSTFLAFNKAQGQWGGRHGVGAVMLFRNSQHGVVYTQPWLVVPLDGNIRFGKESHAGTWAWAGSPVAWDVFPCQLCMAGQPLEGAAVPGNHLLEQFPRKSNLGLP